MSGGITPSAIVIDAPARGTLRPGWRSRINARSYEGQCRPVTAVTAGSTVRAHSLGKGTGTGLPLGPFRSPPTPPRSAAPDGPVGDGRRSHGCRRQGRGPSPLPGLGHADRFAPRVGGQGRPALTSVGGAVRPPGPRVAGVARTPPPGRGISPAAWDCAMIHESCGHPCGQPREDDARAAQLQESPRLAQKLCNYINPLILRIFAVVKCHKSFMCKGSHATPDSSFDAVNALCTTFAAPCHRNAPAAGACERDGQASPRSCSTSIPTPAASE